MKKIFISLMFLPFICFGGDLIKIDDKKTIEKPAKIILLNPSSFKQEQDVYKNYVKYLLNNGYSINEIKKNMQENSNTIKGNLLKAIYYDYDILSTHNPAGFYYNIINNGKEKIKGTVDAVYVADYLIRNKNFSTTLEILPDGVCDIFDDQYKYKCFFYQSYSKYQLDQNYEVELEKSLKYNVSAQKFKTELLKPKSEKKK